MKTHQYISPRISRNGTIKYDVRLRIHGELRHLGTYDSLQHALSARMWYQLSQLVAAHIKDMEDANCTEEEQAAHIAITDQLKDTIEQLLVGLPTSAQLFAAMDAFDVAPQRRIEAASSQTRAAKVIILSPERFVEIHSLVDRVAPHLQPEYALTVGVAAEEYKLYFDRLMHMGPPGEAGVAHRGEQSLQDSLASQSSI